MLLYICLFLMQKLLHFSLFHWSNHVTHRNAKFYQTNWAFNRTSISKKWQANRLQYSTTGETWGIPLLSHDLETGLAAVELAGSACRSHLSWFWSFLNLSAVAYSFEPAKWLCEASSVCWWAFGCLSPCAFSLHRWLVSCLQHRERESRVSVFPCQYIAYPQQVLCSAFSWLQVFLGAPRPQNWTARAKLAWPNSRAGGGGRKSQRLRKRMRSSLAIG